MKFSQKSHRENEFLTFISQERGYNGGRKKARQENLFAFDFLKLEISNNMTEEIKNVKIDELCEMVKTYCKQDKYRKCLTMVGEMMGKFPDSAVPHNLYGIVLENMGNHVDAMKHFRAAIALEPAYRPANWNLQIYGTFLSEGHCAYNEEDVDKQYRNKFKVKKQGL